MSWFGTGSARYVNDDLEFQFAATPQSGYGEVESAEQIEQVDFLVKDLIWSGAWGNGPFTFSANGHANPDNKPEGNWSPDYVSITLNTTKE